MGVIQLIQLRWWLKTRAHSIDLYWMRGNLSAYARKCETLLYWLSVASIRNNERTFYGDESMLKDDKIGNKILWVSSQLSWDSDRHPNTSQQRIPHIHIRRIAATTFNLYYSTYCDCVSIEVFNRPFSHSWIPAHTKFWCKT